MYILGTTVNGKKKKAKAKIMLKILNKMGPKSITDLFLCKSEKTEYHL